MKVYVTSAELLRTINSAIAGDPTCMDCEVTGPLYHLRTPEEDGANWSDSLLIRAHGRDPRSCLPSAARAALAARSQYALRNDGGWLEDIVFSAEDHHFMGITDQRNSDQQTYWYVTVDSDPAIRAFPATTQDTEAEALRDQIVAWWKDGAVPEQSRRVGSNVSHSGNFRTEVRVVERFVHRSFQIDANRINSRGRLEHMNRLEQWQENGVIHLDMSEVAHSEARAGGDLHRSTKALSYIYSMTYANSADEQQQLHHIETLLFPVGANDQNERNDVEIVFNALKYGRILVTNDGGSKTQPGGILGKRAELAALHVTVMRDSEAVVYVEGEIRKRDAMAREIAALTGLPLPDWVGKD